VICASHQPPGITLVELLIVISLLSIFAGLVLTCFEPSIHDQLQGAAQVIAADLDYARSLAVSNTSTYRCTFDADADRYVLTHSGENTALDVLPPSAYRRPDDAPEEQSTELSRMPGVNGRLDLLGVVTASDPPMRISVVEYGPLGETTRSDGATIWLAGGEGESRRYISVTVDPTTGMAWIGEFQATPPDLPEP
jgi:Tfp pilus assembly protein FimT